MKTNFIVESSLIEFTFFKKLKRELAKRKKKMPWDRDLFFLVE